MLAIPITYVNNLNSDGSMDDTNDLPITELTMVFASSISKLIDILISQDVISNIVEIQNSSMNYRVIELVYNLHVNAHENFKKLRLHLTKENDSFVKELVKPQFVSLIAKLKR